MTNMTNDGVIFLERRFLEIHKNYSIFIYNIYIIYKYEQNYRNSENCPIRIILLSFVTIVTLCHELTARKFGYPEYFEYLCNSKINNNNNEQ